MSAVLHALALRQRCAHVSHTTQQRPPFCFLQPPKHETAYSTWATLPGTAACPMQQESSLRLPTVMVRGVQALRTRLTTAP
eukprot:346254-Pelagomonas_calceolata.AAC.18